MRVALGVFLATSLVAGAAEAHIKLTYPRARHAQDALGDPQKAGPCGLGGARDVRGSNVSVFEPGQQITVTWDETITHPGHFRILFDKDGQAFPDPKGFTDYDAGGPKTLADNVPHEGDGAYSVTVTLPDVECASCTLQLLQVMTDKPPFGPAGGSDFYYQCADITLSSAATPADGGGTAKTDAGTRADGGRGASDGAEPQTGGGCAVAPGAAPTRLASLLGLTLAASAARRRARRRRG